MELVENIPYGLVSCFLDGRQVTVLALSDARFAVRVREEVTPGKIELKFLRFEKAEWETVKLSCFRLVSVMNTSCGLHMTVETEDTSYRNHARRALMELARYVRLKGLDDDEELARELTGCPGGETVLRTLSDQKRKWFSAPFAQVCPGERELCLSIDRPDSYDRFMRMEFGAFQTDFFARSFLSDCPLFDKRADRVYIGNPHCIHLFPENLKELTERAHSEKLGVTVVLPPLRESASGFLSKVMPVIASSAADEIAVNDWGTLLALRGCGKRLLLGTCLNRRRKDPRMKYKPGIAAGAEIMKKNDLNDDEWREKLISLGITRFEFESCLYPQVYPAGRVSLHLPFYLTNGSHGCLIAASCEGTDPGLGRDEETCPRYCLSRARLYADELHLAGRYNALFGADTDILTDEAYAERALCGVDRIVAELL